MRQGDLIRARKYIAASEWQYAKTMPQWPHYYTIREWNPDKAAEFYYFAYLIHEYGYMDPWGENEWFYLRIDEYKYWVIDNVLNRAAPKSNRAVMAAGRRYIAKRQRNEATKKKE